MNKHITSAILVILFSTICIVQAIETKQRKPVIGILTQPSGFIKYPEQKYSYIFSSYVEYFERNGAQTIFIKYNWSYEKIDKILNSINGIVIPGGGSNLFFKNGKSKTYTDFAIKGKYIIEQVINKNREGNYFPLWGTCLGFELIQIVFANNNYQILKKREGRNHSGQIEVFPDQLIKSRMFKGFTDYESLRYVQENPALFFNHKFGVKYEDYQNKYQQTKIFRVIGISHDLNGRNFISMAEHKEFPFYGVQFHPEKNRYDFDPNLPINHEELGKKFTDYLSKFFVNECKKNNQIYKNKRELTLYSLKNYKTFRVKDYTMRVYFFNKNRNDQKKLLPDVQIPPLRHRINKLQQKKQQTQANIQISNQKINLIKENNKISNQKIQFQQSKPHKSKDQIQNLIIKNNTIQIGESKSGRNKLYHSKINLIKKSKFNQKIIQQQKLIESKSPHHEQLTFQLIFIWLAISIILLIASKHQYKEIQNLGINKCNQVSSNQNNYIEKYDTDMHIKVLELAKQS